jgi:hypothetical protein
MIVSKVQKKPKMNRVPASTATEAPVLNKGASHDTIRERAFQIYESRGSKPGHDMQDWLRAEQQISKH